MNLLSDIITYMRRIIKTPSNAQITDNLLIDYINRFWINDVDARLQLFDLKTKYAFQTQPGVDRYNMPLYNVQTEGTGTGSGTINFYPVYQGFLGPAYINGVNVSFQTQKTSFFNSFPNIVQYGAIIATGNGTSGPYTLQFPLAPGPFLIPNPPLQAILRGHVDITGIIATGNNIDPPLATGLSPTLDFNIPSTSIDPAIYFTTTDATGANMVVQDSGQFLSTNVNLGLLMSPGTAPFGYTSLPNGYLSSFAITGASQAIQCVLTCTSTYAIGQTIQINGVNGMTQLNGNTYTVVNNTGTLLTINVNSLGFSLYASGGTASSIQNTINYLTGIATNVYFPNVVPNGVNINSQCYFFQTGLPRSILYYNNVLTLRSPPASQYLVELDAYLTPSAFLQTTQAVQFAYMSEYIARGSARKVLSDTGDVEQFQFYEPLFQEQELLVWKRSQRQWTATRTQTLYSQGGDGSPYGYGGMGAGTIY